MIAKLFRLWRLHVATRRHAAKVAEAIKVATAFRKALREQGAPVIGDFIIIRVAPWWYVATAGGQILDHYATSAAAIRRCRELHEQQADRN